MMEYDVMKLAGHAKFETTHKYYLAVRDDLIDRARLATARGLCKKLVRIGARPFSQTELLDKANKKSLYYHDLNQKRP